MNDVTLTDAAKKQVKKALSEREQAKGLRLSTKYAGCSGLKYVLDYVDEEHADDHRFVIDDNLMLYVDKKSLPFVEGTKIDFVKENLRSYFTYENPNEKGSCGCGESFQV